MCQDVNEKDICQSVAVCATYPTHSDWSKWWTCDLRQPIRVLPWDLHMLKWSGRSLVLILRSLARVSLKLSFQHCSLPPYPQSKNKSPMNRETLCPSIKWALSLFGIFRQSHYRSVPNSSFLATRVNKVSLLSRKFELSLDIYSLGEMLDCSPEAAYHQVLEIHLQHLY